MRPFGDFLTEFLAIGTTSAEDALAAFLPLARQLESSQVLRLRSPITAQWWRRVSRT